MAYQIVEVRPTYCQITDGIIGNSYHRLPMVYSRADYAHKLSGFMDRRDYENCGDNTYFVVEAGEPVLNSRGRPNRHQLTYTFKDADGNVYDTGIYSHEVF